MSPRHHVLVRVLWALKEGVIAVWWLPNPHHPVYCKCFTTPVRKLGFWGDGLSSTIFEFCCVIHRISMARNPTDDVSQVVLLLDVNPFFWGAEAASGGRSNGSGGLAFDQYFQHALMFVNGILLLNHTNRIVIIATGSSTCAFLYDSTATDGINGSSVTSKANKKTQVSRTELITKSMQEFVSKEEEASKESSQIQYSNISGSLSMALCYIQRVLRGPLPHPQARILCLQGSPDAPYQYISVMNSIFSAQRNGVVIDACVVGSQHSAFLQQATHITGGIYMKPPQPDGLFEYLMMVFTTDLFSRQFLQLPRPVGVDFRASCFCHKKTIDMGFVCSVCLSIFCKHHQTCSTCGATFSRSNSTTVTGMKRKAPGSWQMAYTEGI